MWLLEGDEDLRRRLRHRVSGWIEDVGRQLSARTFDSDAFDYLAVQCDQLCQQLGHLGSRGWPEAEEASCLVWEAYCELLKASRQTTSTDALGYQVGVEVSGKGKPRFDIKAEQLRYFLNNGFDCSTIASMLGVSRSTIQRRFVRYELCAREAYSEITDAELDALVARGKQQFSRCGYRVMDGLLRSPNTRVQQHRVRESMRRCDPDGVAERWLSTIHPRCIYTVYGPQALWHVDGNHKLIWYNCAFN